MNSGVPDVAGADVRQCGICNNGEKSIYPNEAIMANMIGIGAGEDKLFEAYFNNDAKILLNALTGPKEVQEKIVHQEVLDDRRLQSR